MVECALAFHHPPPGKIRNYTVNKTLSPWGRGVGEGSPHRPHGKDKKPCAARVYQINYPRMDTQTSRLADHLASLRAPIAPSGAGWRRAPKSPEALVAALIAAIFARIFARLEQILRLWQSGNLPPPPTRPTPPIRTNPDSAPRAATHPKNRRPSPTPIVIPNAVKDPRFFPRHPKPLIPPQATPMPALRGAIRTRAQSRHLVIHRGHVHPHPPQLPSAAKHPLVGSHNRV